MRQRSQVILLTGSSQSQRRWGSRLLQDLWIPSIDLSPGPWIHRSTPNCHPHSLLQQSVLQMSSHSLCFCHSIYHRLRWQLLSRLIVLGQPFWLERISCACELLGKKKRRNCRWFDRFRRGWSSEWSLRDTSRKCRHWYLASLAFSWFLESSSLSRHSSLLSIRSRPMGFST